MSTSIRFGWLIQYRSSEALFGKIAKSRSFVPKESETYYNRISSYDQPLYHPIEFNPTNLFHLTLRTALLDKFNVRIAEKNFPYIADLPLIGRSRFNASLQLFLPNILAVRITCFGESTLDMTTAFRLRRFEGHTILRFISDFIVDQALSESSAAPTPKVLQISPILRLATDSPGEVFLPENRTFLAALLINDQNYRSTDVKVLEGIHARNDAHNRKATGARQILINKQGVLSVITNSAVNFRSVEQEIVKKENLFILGAALRFFYQMYPAMRLQYPNEMDYLFYVTTPYVKHHSLTFQMSVANTLAWEVIMESFQLELGYDAAQRLDAAGVTTMRDVVDRLPGRGYAFSSFWSDVRSALASAA